MIAFGWLFYTFDAMAEHSSIKEKYRLLVDVSLLLFAAFTGFVMGALVQDHAKAPTLAASQLNGILVATFGILLADLLRDHYNALPHEPHTMFMVILIFFVAGAACIKRKTKKCKQKNKSREK